jgi:hypothetical protein
MIGWNATASPVDAKSPRASAACTDRDIMPALSRTCPVAVRITFKMMSEIVSPFILLPLKPLITLPSRVLGDKVEVGQRGESVMSQN